MSFRSIPVALLTPNLFAADCLLLHGVTISLYLPAFPEKDTKVAPTPYHLK